MNFLQAAYPLLAHLFALLYPRPWRERYGTEFEAFLQTGDSALRAAANVVWWAVWEHVRADRGGEMDRSDSSSGASFGAMMKQPSAFLPLAMSLTAFAMVCVNVAIYGAVREADEGTMAHLWQLLMAGQMPIVAFFAIKWLPRAPRQTLYVLAEQAGAALASFAAVFFFHLG